MEVGKYLSLETFCTCTQTYEKYADHIDPYPRNPDSIVAIKALNTYIIDPIIDHFGYQNFQLTYGFCSPDLKRFLNKKDPKTGIKNGRIDPSRDQHMAHEINRNGNYYCSKLGAACDFLILKVKSEQVIDWIVKVKLPFDSLYYYGSSDRPIHISYSPQNKKAIWTFTAKGTPTRKGTEKWQKLIQN
ncbi:MAG: hypothetical protein ACLFQP_01365 [Halothece sp.]